MANRNYDSYTIDAFKLIKNGKIKADENSNKYYEYSFDTSSIIDNGIIEQTVAQPSNALYDQICLIYDKEANIYNKTSVDSTFMLDKIVHLNFANIFKNKETPITDIIRELEALLDDSENAKDRYNLTKAHLSTTKQDENPALTMALKIYYLFKNGFYMTLNNSNFEKKTVHMLPFEKTTSLSRKSQMLFVNEELLPYYYAKDEARKDDDIVNRIMLGMELPRKSAKDIFNSISISKFFAYRGLMTSSAKPCKCVKSEDDSEGKYPVLNEKTFVVINDTSCCVKSANFITIDNIDKDEKINLESDEELKQYLHKDSFKIGNMYDGQGLCSTAFAKLISKQYDSTEYNKAFQFRMPFCKGMLHSLDYKDIILKYFTHNDEGLNSEQMYDKIYIKDAFGIYRKFSDIEVIITKSQFKFFNFINHYYSAPNGIIAGSKEYNKCLDPMFNYFDNFYKYQYAFYVLSTNNYEIEQEDITATNDSEASDKECLNFKGSSTFNSTVNFNYQFLLTTPITNTDFKNFIKNKFDPIFNIPNNEITVNSDASFKPDTDKRLIEFLSADKFVKKNPLMLNEQKMKNRFESKRQSCLKQLAGGRFEIKGSNQYLARDLIAMLYDIIGPLEGANGTQQLSRNVCLEYMSTNGLKRLTAIDDNSSNLTKLYHHLLPLQCFYSRNYANQKKTLFALYRSPHYSRNEIGLLSSYSYSNSQVTLMNSDKQYDTLNLYQKYCNAYSVLQIARKSTIADRLGGADFDGDSVNAVNESIIVDSIAKYFGLKKDFGAKPYFKNLLQDWFNIYNERNPFVSIQTGKPNKTTNKFIAPEYSDNFNKLTLPAIFRSFFNNIGIFSNNIFKISANEYLDKYYNYTIATLDAKTNNKIDMNSPEPMNEECSRAAIGAIINGNLIDYAKTAFMPTNALSSINEYLHSLQKQNPKSELEVGKNFIYINKRIKDYCLYLSNKSSTLNKDFIFPEVKLNSRYFKIKSFKDELPNSVWFHKDENQVDTIDAKTITFRNKNNYTSDSHLYIKDFDYSLLPVYNCGSLFSHYLENISSNNFSANISAKSDYSQYTFGKFAPTEQDMKSIDQIAALISAYSMIKYIYSSYNKSVRYNACDNDIRSIQALLNQKLNIHDKQANELSIYNYDSDDISNITLNAVVNELINCAVSIGDVNDIHECCKTLLGLDGCKELKLKYDSKHKKDAIGKPLEVESFWIYSGDSNDSDKIKFLDSLFENYYFTNPTVKKLAFNILIDFRYDGAMLLPTILQMAESKLRTSSNVVIENYVNSNNMALNCSDGQVDSKRKTHNAYFAKDESYCEYFKQMNEILRQAILLNASSSTFYAQLRELCVKELKLICNEANNTWAQKALCYVHFASKRTRKVKDKQASYKPVDPNLEFLFNIFSADEIMQVVANVKEEKNA